MDENGKEYHSFQKKGPEIDGTQKGKSMTWGRDCYHRRKKRGAFYSKPYRNRGGDLRKGGTEKT